jgi:Zn-dependent peptidase ImmA (M78 family)/transcriptional regulator with XRE-family HTH domain
VGIVVPEFNGAMLRLARQFRGFQQKELAERAQVDAAIISRAENGAIVPSESAISRLAQGLNVPEALFGFTFQPIGLPISYHPMWRKRQSVSQRETDRVLADANMRGLHLRRMLPSVELEPELPIPRIEPGEYGNDCREIARLVRRAWGMPAGAVANLTEYVERAGIFIFHVDLEKNVDVDGLTLRLAGLPPVIILNSRMQSDRMRFSLAHELAHLVMHPVPTPEMEDQANKFASELLIPSQDIRACFVGRRVDLKLLAQLKPEWRVSMAALLYAAGEIGVIGPGQSQTLWRQYSSLRYKSAGEPPELNFPVEKPSLGGFLVHAHVDDFGYSFPEMVELLGLPEEDIREMYDLPGPRRGLRLVN